MHIIGKTVYSMWLTPICNCPPFSSLPKKASLSCPYPTPILAEIGHQILAAATAATATATAAVAVAAAATTALAYPFVQQTLPLFLGCSLLIKKTK